MTAGCAMVTRVAPGRFVAKRLPALGGQAHGAGQTECMVRAAYTATTPPAAAKCGDMGAQGHGCIWRLRGRGTTADDTKGDTTEDWKPLSAWLK